MESGALHDLEQETDTALDEIWLNEVVERRKAFLDGRLEMFDYDEIRNTLLNR
jgi:hypothetical protein